MLKNKFLRKDMSIHQRQTIDLILWWAIISTIALLFYTVNEAVLFSYPVIIILVILFRFMYVNNKIAMEEIKKTKCDGKDEH